MDKQIRYVCMHACTYICMYVCMICVCVYTIYTHTYISIYIHSYVEAHGLFVSLQPNKMTRCLPQHCLSKLTVSCGHRKLRDNAFLKSLSFTYSKQYLHEATHYFHESTLYFQGFFHLCESSLAVCSIWPSTTQYFMPDLSYLVSNVFPQPGKLICFLVWVLIGYRNFYMYIAIVVYMSLLTDHEYLLYFEDLMNGFK